MFWKQSFWLVCGFCLFSCSVLKYWLENEKQEMRHSDASQCLRILLPCFRARTSVRNGCRSFVFADRNEFASVWTSSKNPMDRPNHHYRHWQQTVGSSDVAMLFVAFWRNRVPNAAKNLVNADFFGFKLPIFIRKSGFFRFCMLDCPPETSYYLFIFLLSRRWSANQVYNNPKMA